MTLDSHFNGQPAYVRPNIWLLPRGHRWVHAGRTFVSLGGAPSIGYKMRSAGKSWWAEKVITAGEAAAVSDAGHAEVTVTHDTPSPATPRVDFIRTTNPFGWDTEELSYTNSSVPLLAQAYDAVLPDVLFHGHHHVADRVTFDSGRRIHSLDMDGRPGNIIFLDLRTFAVAPMATEPPPFRENPSIGTKSSEVEHTLTG